MKGTFRWKLMASYLFLILLTGGALYAVLAYRLEDDLVSGMRAHLADEVREATLMAAKEVRDIHRDPPEFAASLARAIRARVTIIAPDGVVTADSELTPEEVSRLENHAGRPEIRQAQAKGVGSSIRYSATLRTDMMYVAAPFGVKGMVRLALPLSEVEKAKETLRHTLGAALAASVLASLMLSYVLSNLTARPLAGMAAAAARIGRGDFTVRVPVTGRDELGDLAQVMNDMALRIEGQLERMSSEKKRLDTILKGMGEGVMVTDADGIVTLMNPALCTLFGIAPEMEGRPLVEVSRHPALQATCRKVAAAGVEEFQEITLAAGETILVHWVPLVEEERITGVVAVFHDISDIRKVERIRRDFVANVSHELRTPVTVIKGFAETLLGGSLENDSERRERFAGIIYRHAERLSTLISDLLTLSELESSELSLQPRPVDLEQAIRHALLLLEPKAEEKGVALDLSGLSGGGKAMADQGRLEQVIINLADNAIKYTPTGGTVTLEAVSEGAMVRVLVRDTGIGIPEQDLPRIFERFYRVDTARSREAGGTGLGLSIVKHIVQAHGGTVSVQSTPGAGSVFSFTLKRG